MSLSTCLPKAPTPADKKLSIEALESRLNLSTLTGLHFPHTPDSAAHSRWVSSRLATATSAHALGGSTNSLIGGTNWVAPGTYSAIYQSKLETRRFGADIGYVSPAGAFVEYTVTAPHAGPYTLTIGVASNQAASFTAWSNGKVIANFSMASTGGWDNILYLSQTVTLNAGTQVIRFGSTNHTQYNLTGFQLLYQGATQSTQTNPPATKPVVAPPTSTVTTSAPDAPAAVSVTQRSMTSFTELDVTGITSNASIYVTQSGNTLTITANNQTQKVTGNFGTLMIFAGSGTAKVTVDSTVTLDTSIYSGTGNDTLTNATQGQATIVTLDGGSDILTGNGVNTAFWADARDTINATAAEQANGGLHVISSMYQPFTSTVGASGFITGTRDGANLKDPSASTSTTTRLTSSSFWGTGPVQTDINQGQSSDCYFLTALQSLARLQPGRLQQMGVDLGDGTYVVAFQRSGKTQYVRVDGDLPSSGPYAGGLQYAHPGASGDQWVPIFEKAYAEFRSGANSYGSLDIGFMSPVYFDLGVSNSFYVLPTDPSSFYATASSKLAANKAVDILTNPTIINNAPLVQSHTYSVVSVSQDSSGAVWVTMRNPWGFDGFNVDSNGSDGMITVSYSALKANCYLGTTVS